MSNTERGEPMSAAERTRTRDELAERLRGVLDYVDRIERPTRWMARDRRHGKNYAWLSIDELRIAHEALVAAQVLA